MPGELLAKACGQRLVLSLILRSKSPSLFCQVEKNREWTRMGPRMDTKRKSDNKREGAR
jgi:hypothetical protein